MVGLFIVRTGLPSSIMSSDWRDGAMVSKKIFPLTPETLGGFWWWRKAKMTAPPDKLRRIIWTTKRQGTNGLDGCGVSQPLHHYSNIREAQANDL